MGLFRRCKEQWALVKEMRTMFKAEWERAKRWHSITQAEAESLSDEELWDCMTSRLPQRTRSAGKFRRVPHAGTSACRRLL